MRASSAAAGALAGSSRRSSTGLPLVHALGGVAIVTVVVAAVGLVESSRARQFGIAIQGTFPDSDHDGLSDSEERRLGTDPFNADTDGG